MNRNITEIGDPELKALLLKFLKSNDAVKEAEQSLMPVTGLEIPVLQIWLALNEKIEVSDDELVERLSKILIVPEFQGMIELFQPKSTIALKRAKNYLFLLLKS